MTSELLHEAFERIDDRLIIEAEEGRFDAGAREKRRVLFAQMAAVAAGLFIAVVMLYAGDPDKMIKAGGGGRISDFESVLDSDVKNSDRTGEEIVSFMNDFNPDSIDEAFLFVNRFFVWGNSMNVTKQEHPELLEGLISMIFNDNIEYTEVECECPSDEYEFYITFANTKTGESFTVFVFGYETIKCDGLCMRASSSLDYAAVNKVIIYSKKHGGGENK